MIQLISRNIAIYRSLARIKQDPATCHQKLQEPELAWETIQFPQELQPEIKEIEDLHIKQKLEPNDKFSVSKHSLFGQHKTVFDVHCNEKWTETIEYIPFCHELIKCWIV
jgi:hypothetical protein